MAKRNTKKTPATPKQLTEQDWTMAEDKRYAELRWFLLNVDEPSVYFDMQVELVSLRNKALACGLDCEPLPF